jgi:hypothetical protein
VLVSVYPRFKLRRKPRKVEEKVLFRPEFDFGFFAEHAFRVYQVRGVEYLAARFALVSSCSRMRAVGARSLDIAVGKEFFVKPAVRQLHLALLYEAVFVYRKKHLLCEFFVRRRRRSSEMREIKRPLLVNIALYLAVFVGIRLRRHAFLHRGDFRLRAVFVRAADVNVLNPEQVAEAVEYIGRQYRAYQVAEMLYSVDIGQCGCYGDAFGMRFPVFCMFRRFRFLGRLRML